MVDETVIALIISLLSLILSLMFVAGPKVTKLLLKRYYQPLSVSFTEEVNNGNVVWPENEKKTDAVPGDGEWDLFEFKLSKVGWATPHVERIRFHSSIQLEERDYAKKWDRVITASSNLFSDYMFHYEWNPDRLTNDITGENGKKIHHSIYHLPFKRPNQDFEMAIEIQYKIPLEDLPIFWSSDYINLRPVKKHLCFKIPNNSNSKS